jgi:hypothetical protein
MKNESIGKILEELEKTRQFLVKFHETGVIPGIERDIVLANMRSMYEFIRLIQLEETEHPATEEKPHDIIPEPEILSVNIEMEAKVVDFVEESEKEMAPVPEKSSVLETHTPVIDHEATPHMNEKSQKSVKTEILAEKFQSQGFLNETLAKYQDVTDLSKKMQSQPIKDIFSAINLNDKFLFIKELFNNDAALYQSTIEKLNSAGSFNDAVRYLDGNFAWDFSDAMVQNFLELVRRRFL